MPVFISAGLSVSPFLMRMFFGNSGGSCIDNKTMIPFFYAKTLAIEQISGEKNS